MLNKNIHPSTICGIKRHAKQIKKAAGTPHHEALDIAARSASFENFAHARNVLQNSSRIKPGCKLFFTTYWYDRQNHQSGREVLEIELSLPLLEIATKSELKRVRGLSWFRLALPDNFVSDHLCGSQSQAIERICYAVRVLRFIESTGLKPSGDYSAAYPNREHVNRLPKTDHSTVWVAPDTGQFILIDEPYLSKVFDNERDAWAKKHNWHLQASQWSGMYYPGMSKMFVVTDASTGYDFNGLMDKINRIPPPLTMKTWAGTSTNGLEPFFSPLCISPQDKKRAVAKATVYRAPSSKTLPIRSWGDPSNDRRPNAVMPVEAHQLAARLIKAIENSEAKPSSVNSRLSSIKSELENWFF